MRTRFLNIDYFSHSSEKTLKDTINFSSLPVPRISNPFVDTKSQTETEIFGFESVFDINFEIETFQIDEPLSLFFNEVLPHRIDDLPSTDFLSSNSNSYFDGANYDEEDQRNSQSQTDLNRFQERGNEISGEEKDKGNFNIIPFETPELDFFLEDPACVFKHVDNLVLPETEMTLDLRAAIPYPCTLSESIYFVEDITLDFQIDEKRSYVVEDACLVQDKNYLCTPHWEVNEFELGVHPSPCMEEEFHILLQSIGFQQWTVRDKQLAQGDDLMRYIKTANLEFLFKPRPLEQCLEPQPAILDMVLQMDFICLHKSPDFRENPMVTLEVSDVEYFQVLTSVHFQEYQILDLNCIQPLEVFFSSQPVNQTDTCDSIFSENDAFKQLYESIISHELALVDDSFKSFPIPVFSDDKYRLSPYTIMQEILADLKPHCPSASDEIYLDWNLLLQDRWSSDWNVMEEIDSYCISSTLNSTDTGLVIYDFVFSEETPDGSLTVQDSEKLKEPFSDFGSTNLVEDADQKPVMSKPGTSEKVPTLSDSMSNFNDLSFFLNPRKSSVKQNAEPAVKDTTSYIYDTQKRSKQEVFEGDTRYLTAIMESSDGLYAAAASLGIGLQLFCSHSSELTDEIVMSCIDYSLRSNKGQYRKMPDTETLAESFLTRFPSIHPLSAHVILSSGGILVEFLECSSDHRIQAIEKCHVPNQSVSLFSSVCSFGEHEGSKSGTTDCSSVSPASESNSRLRTETQKKRQKCVLDPQTLNIHVDGNFLLEPLIQSNDMDLKPPRVPQPFHSLISSKHQEVDENVTVGFQPAEKIFGQKQSLKASSTNNSEWNQIFASSMNTDLKGEVIDLTESSMLGEDFFSSADTLNFTKKVPSRGNDHAMGNSSVARRLSFGLNDFPDFPSSAEMNSESDMWTSVKARKRRLEDIDSIPLSYKTGREFFEEQNLSRSTSNAHGLFKENNSRYYGSKPFCDAFNSLRHQQGSPWTKEFLSKIRERSRIRQKSLHHQTMSHDYEYSGSKEKIAKTKSPSLMDFYKYDGGSKSKKITNQKLQKRLIHPPVSASKNEKASSSVLQSWTPIDKRAKQLHNIN